MEQGELFARVNDSIRKLAEANDPAAQRWEFICECEDMACHTFVSLTLSEFDKRRSTSPPEPILATEHKAPRALTYQ
jgi:hypothetical protein